MELQGAFSIFVRSDKESEAVLRLSDDVSMDFRYQDGYVKFEVSDLDIFEMYKVVY